MLPGGNEQTGAQFAYGILRGELVIGIGPAAAGFGHKLAAQHQIAIGQGKEGLNHGFVSSATHHIRAELVTGQEVDGFKNKALARPGFAGQHIEAGGELQFHVLNEGQVADAQQFKHAWLTLLSFVSFAYGRFQVNTNQVGFGQVFRGHGQVFAAVLF